MDLTNHADLNSYRGWFFPHECPAELIALAALDADQVWLLTLREAQELLSNILSEGSVIFTGGWMTALSASGRVVMRVSWSSSFSRTGPRSCSRTWGRGYASGLAQAAVEHWSDLPERLPLIAYTTADNIASQKTAERADVTRRPDLDETNGDVWEVVFAIGLD